MVYIGDVHCTKNEVFHEGSFFHEVYLVNVTKSAVSFGSGHIYCINPGWRTSFFVQWYLRICQTAMIEIKETSPNILQGLKGAPLMLLKYAHIL